MPLTRPLVSAVKSAVIRVRTIEQARPFYEGLLGLRALAETDVISDKTRRLWGLQARQVRCLRLGKPGEHFGQFDLIEIADQAAEPIRDPARPWDYGWLSLNLRTNNLTRACEAVRALGAQLVSEPVNYEAGGQPMRQVMVNLVSGERVTLLQTGEPVAGAPLFGEALATVSVAVPSAPESLVFYRDALGLSVAMTRDQTGEPWATLLDAPAGTRVQSVLFTSGGNWTGKYELLQLTLPPGSPPPMNVNSRADGRGLGLWMMSVITPDLDLLQTACRRAGVSTVRGPATVDRPCFGRVKALIARAPGGELLECMATATGPVLGR